MTYERFEDLPVWQESMRLAHGVYDLTENPAFQISYSLRDQIERSSMSYRKFADPRHAALNEKTRLQFERRQKAEAARKVLLKTLPAWHPLRKEAEERGEI